jgi:hypothetical protein
VAKVAAERRATRATCMRLHRGHGRSGFSSSSLGSQICIRALFTSPSQHKIFSLPLITSNLSTHA